ncbi:polysaccharide biosynthesis protein [Alkalimarinus coralli]|uniref:polysaccharide biosynthesis protein n=1 Tax=Alkalimarinus coralli TaxID=2935863 RepID=UPI00202B4E32|nr:polysaccharide biosynthesis protein [Alkalimarinus coralli]
MGKDTGEQEFKEGENKKVADNGLEGYELERHNEFLERSSVLVPSSMELGSGGVEKYIISKQIAKMDEPKNLNKDDLIEKKIIFPDSPDKVTVNKFRALRTKILERSGNNNFALLVASVKEGGGGSFVALNLAASFAFDAGKTALIIDCNLGRPELHSKLDLIPDIGLTDFLNDPNMDIASIIYPTGIPRLRLIPAGTRAEFAGEYFSSFRMKQFLHALRKRYPDRYIIIDAPDFETSPDSRILSDLCDYSMLVVPHGVVGETEVADVAASLSKEKLLGVVING